MYLSDTMPMLLLAKNTTKRYNTLNVNNLGEGYCAANNPFKLNSASVSTGLYKTYLGAFARHLVGLLCLCVLKTES